MTEAAHAVASLAVTRAREALGPRLLAAYALGSLAHGGFSPLVSDVDVGLVLADPLQETDAAAVERISTAVTTSGLPLAERLSVFWGTPRSMNCGVGGRFPAIDRADLFEHGQRLDGTEVRHLLVAPSVQDSIVDGARFALGRLRTEASIECLTEPERLVAAGPMKLTKLVLFPARLLHTLRTGGIGRNEAAVAHYVATSKAEAAALVTAGLRWRSVPPAIEDDHAQRLLRECFIPLYLELVTHYARHLDTGEHPDLVNGLHGWRDELESSRLEARRRPR